MLNRINWFIRLALSNIHTHVHSVINAHTGKAFAKDWCSLVCAMSIKRKFTHEDRGITGCRSGQRQTSVMVNYFPPPCSTRLHFILFPFSPLGKMCCTRTSCSDTALKYPPVVCLCLTMADGWCLTGRVKPQQCPKAYTRSMQLRRLHDEKENGGGGQKRKQKKTKH